MRPVMTPQPGQARAREHAAHRPLPGLGEETAGQPRERAERRRGEQRGEHGQQRHQRRRDRQHCIREHQRESVLVRVTEQARRLRTPAIMDSVPQTPDQQTRNAVTTRIIAHVTAGWPRLGEPLVRYRGQYCYVAALLPGHRDPIRSCGSAGRAHADNWAIGIYKASTGQYSETELPGAFGGATGTPEQGIDETFILYAGPNRELTER